MGSLYAEGKDATKGFSLLDEACQHSSASGCSRLAGLYEEGRGVAKDPAKAFGLLKQACEGGAASACERVADVSRKAGKLTAAPSTWLEPLCGKGQQSACTAVADLLAHKDPTGAASRYQHACDAGESAACARGARLLLGLPKASAESATRMFQRACDAGDGGACSDLAQRFLTGDHVQKDAAHGIALLEAACLIPDARSCVRAAELHEQGKGADASTKAQSLYQRACHAGAATACAKASSLPAAPAPPDPLGAPADPKDDGSAPTVGGHGK